MKSIFLSLLTVSILTPGLYAQQVNVTFSGTLTGLKDGTKIFLVPDGRDKWRDSTVAKGGKFQFNTKLPRAGQYDVRTSRFYARGQWNALYLDEGTINITGKIDDANEWEITGSPFATDQNDFSKLLRKKGYNRLLKDFYKASDASEQKHDTTVNPGKLFDEKEALRFTCAKEWIKAHPASGVSTYLLWSYSYKFKLDELEAWMNDLTHEAKSNAPGRALQAQVDGPKLTAIGKTAPVFTQNDTSGVAVNLTDLRGKYVLLDFWASWCGPCRAETPHVIPLYNKYKDRSFTIVSISLDSDRQDWTQAIIKDKMPWIHVSDLNDWRNSICVKYGVTSVPFNLLLDPQGKIIARDIHGKDLENKLTEILN